MRLWKNSRKSRRSMMRAPQQSSKDAQLRQILADVLHEREMAKLDKLLSVREDESLTKVLKNLVKVVPNSVKKKHCVRCG